MSPRTDQSFRSLLSVGLLVATLSPGCGAPSNDNLSTSSKANPEQAARARQAADAARDEAIKAEQAAIGDLGIEEQP
ncbi:hypothetical protein [Tautonia rosea]|uniref:hypothetical protein n=1 Tax=Tautonia rosea TaxID=2728037 RepID=UPI001474F2FC|nr:hypothetical protein [Tautonia rosea]